ncbi:MAG: Hsp70 family protein [Deltaproteobacteria bacterium]|nr:Hsp70 family protein [Deltaproteobacteria bacterium]
MRAVGIDFGTTNSAVAVADGGGAPRLATFGAGDGRSAPTLAFRSILHFEPTEGGRGRPRARAGPAALARWLESAGEGRLVQSIKSFLASPLFEATEVYGAVYQLEDLVATILAALRAEAEAQLGPLGARVVAGRPVRFAGEGRSDERLALSRLRSAFARAGFEEVVFEYEPVAAARHYARRLRAPERVLIGDFGGGTSDFSLLALAPGTRAGHEILATSGVGVAGDAFDAKLVRHRVAPLLGRGSRHRNAFGVELTMPHWLYGRLERWHHLSFLKSPRTLQILADLEREALEPERIRAFAHLVREDRGFQVYRAVEAAKHALSEAESARIVYRDRAVGLDAEVGRAAFERWIAPELAKIEACVDEVLAAAGLAPARVDRVFLTGGSAFVPAVRGIFARRFGAERIRGGDELGSVASGLALRAGD